MSKINMDYNTQQEPITLKEYGRNVQKLVKHISAEPDKDKRTQLIVLLTKLIQKLDSTPKGSADNAQRIWDDLYVISDFDLDVNNPYPIPKRQSLLKKPSRMEYPQSKTRSRYGKNIDKLLESILAKEDPKERENSTIYLGRLLNTFHNSWSKTDVDNVTLLKSIEHMSDKKLSLDLEKVEKDNLFEKLYYERRKVRSQGYQNHKKDRKTYGKRHGSTYRRRNP